MKDIKFLSKVFLTLDEIETFYGIREYNDLVQLVNQLLAEGKIAPVKPKDTNGKYPALCKKYRVIRVESIDKDSYLNELKTELPPSFSIDYYRNNIDKYIQHRNYILQLSHFFKFKKDSLETQISINERSFEIWAEEKFLKDNPMSSLILKNLGLSREQLNVYATPEPFFYHVKEDKEYQNILVLENKDTWYSMRKLLNEGQDSFFGIPFTTIIYGEGKKILNGFWDLENNVESCFHNPENLFYYFGDFDYEGAHIYLELKRRTKNYRKIVLLKEAYLLMLNKAQGRTLPKMSPNQMGKKDFEQFLNEFSFDEQTEIKAIIENGLYIPQEIINYQVLKEKRE